MPTTTTVLRRLTIGMTAAGLAASLAGCGANNGNGDSVTPNGVTSEPAASPNGNG
ncbi:MAG: hypothetical protein ACR2JO_10260 [Mycobacteriales bacterium]|jgi:hypothetical protein